MGRIWLGRSEYFSRSDPSLVPGKIVRITERIPETPYRSESTQRFKIRGITVIAPLYPSYSYDDPIQIEGEIKRNASSSPGSLLQLENKNLVLIYPHIRLLGENEVFRFPQEKGFFGLKGLVMNTRERLVGLFRKLLPEPHASLLSGIVVGERASMPDSFHEALRTTGTLHVIAVSGMNISIVGGVLLEALVRLMSRRRAVVIAVIGVWFYALMAGFSAPVIRAAIMGSVAFLALVLGREKDAKRALLLAAGGMLLFNPYYIEDIGWQLSFAATAGIIWWQPWFKRRLGNLHIGAFKHVWKWLADNLSVTLAAYIATLPLLIYHFGQMSWISPLPNLLIVPVVSVATIGGGVLAVWGMLWSMVGMETSLIVQVMSWGVWVLLEYMVWIIEWFGQFGAVDVEKISAWWVIGFYLATYGFFWQSNKLSDKQVDATKG